MLDRLSDARLNQTFDQFELTYDLADGSSSEESKFHKVLAYHQKQIDQAKKTYHYNNVEDIRTKCSNYITEFNDLGLGKQAPVCQTN